MQSPIETDVQEYDPEWTVLDEDLRALLCEHPSAPTSCERVVLPIDKPQGMSSFGVIRRLRRILEVRKIGHAGTLDPMATGLLICLVGRATKLMTRFMELPKEYEGVIRLGQTTPSYDAETQVDEVRPVGEIGRSDIERVLPQFVGRIEQFAPMYSAVKVEGERLYKKARRGEVVDRKPRQVEIYEFDVADRDGDDVPFRVRCSKGTYIRTLAHDLGQTLGCGAHLVGLRRTAIGPVSVDRAWDLDALQQAMSESP